MTRSITQGVFAFLLLALVAIVTARAHNKNQSSPPAVYENAARSFRESIANGVWEGGAIAPRKSLPSQDEDVMFDEVLGYPVHDCSSIKYRCIFSSHRVYAVPKIMLKPADNYVAGGAQFKIEDCLRGDAKICQVAVISSDCQNPVPKDACELIVGGRRYNKNPGPFVYFIYNEDFGITAFGVTGQPAITAGERLTVASQMVLQGMRGLLAK